MRRTWTRRELGRLAAGAAVGGLGASLARTGAQEAAAGKPFRVWVMGNANIETELFTLEDRGREERPDGRESLAEALRQSEGPGGFEWDVALFLGDLSGGRPDKREARMLQNQLAALQKHPREAMFFVAGDRDASPQMKWFERWVDPFGRSPELSGVHAERRAYPLEGAWDHYRFQVGNLVFLMLSDRNDVRPPVGRGPWEEGPYPGGATTMDAFLWWRSQVLASQDQIVVTAHHHLLQDTTYGTGDWEAFHAKEDSGYESFLQEWQPELGDDNKGAGYLYWTWDERSRPARAVALAQNFERHFVEKPGSVDLWLGCHNPAAPDAVLNGRGQVARRWDVSFLNCGGLARTYAGTTAPPWSRLFTFEEGSDHVRVQTYLHTDAFAPQGFHAPTEATLALSKPFRRA